MGNAGGEVHACVRAGLEGACVRMYGMGRQVRATQAGRCGVCACGTGECARQGMHAKVWGTGQIGVAGGEVRACVRACGTGGCAHWGMPHRGGTQGCAGRGMPCNGVGDWADRRGHAGVWESRRGKTGGACRRADRSVWRGGRATRIRKGRRSMREPGGQMSMPRRGVRVSGQMGVGGRPDVRCSICKKTWRRTIITSNSTKTWAQQACGRHANRWACHAGAGVRAGGQMDVGGMGLVWADVRRGICKPNLKHKKTKKKD
jgi:hypothetical protein